MNRLVPYGIVAGIILIAVGGFQTLTATPFSSAAKLLLHSRYIILLLLSIGVLVFITSYVLGLSTKQRIRTLNADDNIEETDYSKRKAVRSLIKKVEKRYSWLSTFLILIIVYLIFKGIIILKTAIALFLIGAVIVTFLLIMGYKKPNDTLEDNRFEGYKLTAKYFRLTDYRNHPISVSLVLFIMIVVYYAWINPFGVMDDFESVDSVYAWSLPEVSAVLIINIFANTFIYISNHYNFLGFQKIHVDNDTVFYTQFAEIIFAGASLFIWVFTLILYSIGLLA